MRVQNIQFTFFNTLILFHVSWQAPDSKGSAPKFAPGVAVWVPWDDDEVFTEAVVHTQDGEIVTVKKAKGGKNVRRDTL